MYIYICIDTSLYCLRGRLCGFWAMPLMRRWSFGIQIPWRCQRSRPALEGGIDPWGPWRSELGAETGLLQKLGLWNTSKWGGLFSGCESTLEVTQVAQSIAHLWVAQATLRNQERNSHATHGSWFDWVNRGEAVVLLQTAHRKVPFSWLIQHHSLGSLLLLSRVATPKILLCCDIFSRGSAIHGRQIVATRPSSCLQRNWHAMNTYRCSRYELRKNQTSVRNSFVRACHRCYMLGRLQI